MRSRFRTMAGKVTPKKYALVFKGAQYIDTGIDHLGDLEISVDFQLAVDHGADYNTVFGTHGAYYYQNRFTFAKIPASEPNAAYRQMFLAVYGHSNYSDGWQYMYRIVAPYNTSRNTIRMRKGDEIEFNGAGLQPIAPQQQPQAPLNIYLGAVNNQLAPPSMYYIGNMFGCRMKRDGVLVRDMIPVPAGDTRYSATPAPSNCLWDMVSKAYFENKGTGAFGIEEVTV